LAQVRNIKITIIPIKKQKPIKVFQFIFFSTFGEDKFDTEAFSCYMSKNAWSNGAPTLTSATVKAEKYVPPQRRDVGKSENERFAEQENVGENQKGYGKGRDKGDKDDREGNQPATPSRFDCLKEDHAPRDWGRGGKDGDRRYKGGGKGDGKSRKDGYLPSTHESSGDDKSWFNRRDGRKGAGSWDETPTELTVFGPVKQKAAGGINFDEYDKIPVSTTGNGSEAINCIERFSDAQFHEQLSNNISRCGYERPTPIQKYSIPIITGQRDLMACAQTGSGKTCAFLVPVLQSMLERGPPNMAHVIEKFRVSNREARIPMPIALVLAPTRELAIQISDEGKKFAFETGIRVCVVYGGPNIHDQRREVNNGVDILVATPGRLTDMKERDIISLHLCRFFMLDEADRMLDMGFEPQVREVAEKMDMGLYESSRRQCLLFSATFPKEVQTMASDFLHDYIFLTVGRVGSTNEFIEQKLAYAADEDKFMKLMNVLKESDGGLDAQNLALVFVETKRGADTLERQLWDKCMKVTAIHGDRTQAEREEALLAFRSGENPLLVATDVAARGLDIPSVSVVVNYDMPKNIDDYVHRIGRTGRAGRKGKAFAFINDHCNRPLLKELNGLLMEAKQEPPLWFREMINRAGGPTRGPQKPAGFDRFGGRDVRSTGRADTAKQWNTEERTGRKVVTMPKEVEVEEKPIHDGWGVSGAEDAW